MIREYRSLDSGLMSANAVTADLFEADYTLPGASENAHKIGIPISAKGLTWQRQRASAREDTYFSEFLEELWYAFDQEFRVNDVGRWTKLSCFLTTAKVVSHMTAKVLIGYPYCRDPELLHLFSEYGNAVPLSGWFIAKFPALLKPVAAMLCPAPKMAKRLHTIISGIAEQRRASPPKAPNDMLDYLMNWVDENPEYNDVHVVRQIVVSVFGAIHTTTQVLVHCLFEIATRKEYVKPLREEIDVCLQRHGGWTKDAVESMHKLDSFVRECQRYNPLDAGSLARRVAVPFTFSNGLHLPTGTVIFAPNAPILFDSLNYPNPRIFDGFRFSNLRSRPGQEHNYTFTSPSLKNLQFGEGRHTCPGRFMAADEIRLLLARILAIYDVAIKDHGARPQNRIFTKILFPDTEAEIMIRKRSD
ncbi:hypothetical protein MMC21_007845 [Puttea exsequens]|nr:hypothetical protein [Puttea exsequens]